MADRSEKHLHGTTHHAEALYQIEKQVQWVDLKIKNIYIYTCNMIIGVT